MARELIGLIVHPLNRAVFDPRVGRVTEGYGILQPRISVNFMSAAGSLFARLYSGHTGVDPYTTAVSDTYQDLFAEGIFTGKGLYDVDAFIQALEDSVPENALLSHDLFEGLHARVGLVSDVELVDDYPSSVLSHARRQHRWVRGDWQILFWLFPFVPSRRGLKRNPLTAIGRWKILDNLRRSLVAPALLALLIAGWMVLPGRRWVWTAMVVGVAASQLLPVLARLLIGPGRSQSFPVFLTNLRHDASTTVAQILLSLTLLAFHAFDALHAISLTLVRLVVTKRRLLEWETAASTAARAAGLVGSHGLRRFTMEMIASPITAAAVAIALIIWRRDALPIATPFLLLWVSAPALAYQLSVPVGPRVRPLRFEERARLRRTARITWRYFETFVTEADGWLPPDNFQEGDGLLPARLARRTSPTNIGMSLLSDTGRARSGLPAHRPAGGTARCRPAHDRKPGALPGTPAQLVRHGHPGSAPSPLRVDCRQRQPRGCAPDPGAGSAGSREPSPDRGAAARGTGGYRRSPAKGLVFDGGIGKPSGRGDDQRPRARHHRRGRRGGFRPPRGHAPGIRAASGGVDRGDRSAGTGRRSRRRRLLGACGAGRAGRSGARARRRAGVPCTHSPPACAPSWTRCASTFSTTVGAASSRSATAWPMPRVQAASTGSSTICWRPKRGWPASSPSPKATSRSSTGSTWDGW